MSTGAIVMLVITLVLVWGGLALALVHLNRQSEHD